MSRSEVPRAELATGVEIPRIVNGCWQLARGHGRQDRSLEDSLEDSLASLLHLAELGLTAFDAADIYTGVEDRLGAFRRRWISAGGDPRALRFHTKFVPDSDRLASLDLDYVEGIVERSRARLGVDRLDLVQFHWWDFRIDGWVETALMLDALRRAGQIAHLGVTNFDGPHLEEILSRGVEIVSNQVQYSLLDRRPERAMTEICRRHGIRLLTYGALAGGFLTDGWLGKPDPGLEVANRSLTKYRLIVDEFGGWDAFQRLLDLLGEIAAKYQVSIANVATRWVLDRPGVAAIILGAADASHAEDNLRCFHFALDEQDQERIEALLARHPGPPGDIYSVERRPGSRHGAIMKTHLNRS